MIDDEKQKQYREIISKKCPSCYSEDTCMLLPSQRALLCLGPFKDYEDCMQKLREDWKREEDKLDTERFERMIKRWDYQDNRLLCEHKTDLARKKKNADRNDE